jgi:hypothetical protein
MLLSKQYCIEARWHIVTQYDKKLFNKRLSQISFANRCNVGLFNSFFMQLMLAPASRWWEILIWTTYPNQCWRRVASVSMTTRGADEMYVQKN